MSKITKEEKKRLIITISLSILVVIIALSNIFYKRLEILLKLKPDITYSCDTQVHFIDVGQGDAIAIRFSNGKTMLVDAGIESHLPKLKNYLDKIILKGDKHIDYVVLTHPDTDHSENMAYILENYEIGTFYRPKIYEEIEKKEPFVTNYSYREVVSTIERKNITTYFHEDNLEIIDGDIKIDWIVVQDINKIIEKEETNDLSPIIIIEDNDVKLMLTGDISDDVEKEVLKKCPKELIDIDILKLAHHGSKYSNSYEFLETLSPKFVVACVGENTFGHPANDVIERILKYDNEYGSELYKNFLNTRDDGNIIFTMSRQDIKVDTIDNIDKYNFVPYFIYTIVFDTMIITVILIPYFKDLYKKIRFIIRNKKHKEMKEKEKLLQENNEK